MKKKMLIFILPLLLLIVGLGVTYAWYTWSNTSEDETVIITTSAGAATVYFSGGSDISDSNLIPTIDKKNGIVKKISVRAKEDMMFDLSFNLYLDVISVATELKEPSFKYAIYKNDTKIKEGNFTQDYLDNNLVECTTNNSSHIVLIEDDIITTTTSTYTLYLWIDGTMDNPIEMSNKSYQFKLHASGENAVMEEFPALVEHISDLYNDAEKTTITNNSIEYYQARIYDTDTDNTTKGGLMNDRLGGTTTDYNAGNIRYYGVNPSNYIDIGDTEINDNGEEVPTLYRIIGLFKDIEVVNDDGTTTTKDLVKVIRNDSIGNYSWDNKSNGIGTSTSSYGSNNWADARLMMLLNPGYEEGLTADDGDIIYGYPGSLYWNSESGTCYWGESNATTPCDFKTKKTGLSTDAQNKIETVVWSLRGHSSVSVYSNEIYNYERTTGSVFDTTRATEWPGKVALMYPSDYGYATDLNSSVCNTNLGRYETSTNSYGCRSNDWLYNSSIYQWLLTQFLSFAGSAWNVVSSGYVGYDHVYSSRGVRPVFYLDSELVIVSGSGTEAEPYVVG